MKPFVRLSDAPILSTSITIFIIIVIISYSIPFASTVLLTLYSVHLDQASLSCTRVLLGFVQFFLSNDIWNHLVQREIHDQVNQARFTTALLGMDKWMKKASLFVHPAPFFMEVMDAAEAKHADTVIFAPARNRRGARG